MERILVAAWEVLSAERGSALQRLARSSARSTMRPNVKGLPMPTKFRYQSEHRFRRIPV